MGGFAPGSPRLGLGEEVPTGRLSPQQEHQQRQQQQQQEGIGAESFLQMLHEGEEPYVGTVPHPQRRQQQQQEGEEQLSFASGLAMQQQQQQQQGLASGGVLDGRVLLQGLKEEQVSGGLNVNIREQQQQYGRTVCSGSPLMAGAAAGAALGPGRGVEAANVMKREGGWAAGNAGPGAVAATGAGGGGGMGGGGSSGWARPPPMNNAPHPPVGAAAGIRGGVAGVADPGHNPAGVDGADFLGVHPSWLEDVNLDGQHRAQPPPMQPLRELSFNITGSMLGITPSTLDLEPICMEDLVPAGNDFLAGGMWSAFENPPIGDVDGPGGWDEEALPTAFHAPGLGMAAAAVGGGGGGGLPPSGLPGAGRTGGSAGGGGDPRRLLRKQITREASTEHKRYKGRHGEEEEGEGGSAGEAVGVEMGEGGGAVDPGSLVGGLKQMSIQEEEQEGQQG